MKRQIRKLLRKIVLIITIIIPALTQKQYAQSKNEIDSLRRIIPAIKEDTVRLRLLTRLSNVLALNLITEGTDSVIREALSLAYKTGDRMAQAEGLKNLGVIFSLEGESDSSLKYTRQALDIFNSAKDGKGIFQCLSNIAYVHLNIGQADSCISYYMKAIGIADKIPEDQKNRILSTVYSGIGGAYKYQADYKKALEAYIKAEKYAGLAHDSMNLSIAIGNIGVIYKTAGDLDKALFYYKRAVEVAQKINFVETIASVYGNISRLYISKGRLDSALFYASKAEAAAAERRSVDDLANANSLKGQIFQNAGNYSSAAKHYLESAKLAEEANDLTVRAASLADAGLCYLYISDTSHSASDYRLAAEYIHQGYVIAKQIGNMEYVKADLENLAEAHSLLKDYKKAYEYSMAYAALSDSLFKEEKSKEFQKLLVSFETSKKEKQIILLNKEKELKDTELARQKAIKSSIVAGAAMLIAFSGISFGLYKRRRDALTKKKEAELNSHITEVEMKALRAQMNPHFIFNSLRSINEYIQHNKSSLASEYLIKFSKLMRAILENSRKKEIILSTEIEVLELYMQLESQRMEHPFTYSIEIDPDIDKENTQIPPMLLQPIIENSIWHGLAPKDKPGKIIIRISKKDEMIYCEVEDDGIGRELSYSENKNDSSKAESYGLKITKERLDIIEQLKKIKTNLSFNDLNGSSTGLCVTFTLPFEEAV